MNVSFSGYRRRGFYNGFMRMTAAILLFLLIKHRCRPRRRRSLTEDLHALAQR
jgi:hypothetical protein